MPSNIPSNAFDPVPERDIIVEPPPHADVARAVDLLIAGIPSPQGQETSQVDLQDLGHVDTELDKLTVALRSIQAEVRARRTALYKQRNSLSPISRLPVELLANILILSLKHYRFTTLRAMKLSAVSAHWWQVLVSTPAVWVDIKFGDAGYRLALQRSENRPLNVRIEEGAKDRPAAREEFAELLQAHAHRWRSLSWEGPGFHRLEPVFATGVFPLLEDLSITTSSPKLITLSNTPRLRSLTLTRVVFLFITTQLPTLTSLSISSISRDILPPFLDLLTFLRATPSLQELKLHGLAYTRTETLPTEQTTIDLPRLAIFEVHGIVETVLIHLLQTVWAENLVDIKIGHSQASAFASDAVVDYLLEEDVYHSLTAATANKDHVEKIVITIEAPTLTIGWGNSSIQLPLESMEHSVEEAVCAMTYDIDKHPVELKLLSEYDVEDLKSLLACLPTLTELTDASGDTGHLSVLFSHLVMGADLPCPNLEVLRLSAPYECFEDEESFACLVEDLRLLAERREEIDILDECGEHFYAIRTEFFMGHSLEDFY